jgi:heme/copper-type cytochrome/quinol oxidase subunit 2
LCGRDHGFMPIVLEVKSKADFEQWLRTQKQAMPQTTPAPGPSPSPTASSANSSAANSG